MGKGLRVYNGKIFCPDRHLERLPILEKNLSLTEFYNADEVFARGTMGELTPVIEIDARKIINRSGKKIYQKKIYQKILEHFSYPYTQLFQTIYLTTHYGNQEKQHH